MRILFPYYGGDSIDFFPFSNNVGFISGFGKI